MLKEIALMMQLRRIFIEKEHAVTHCFFLFQAAVVKGSASSCVIYILWSKEKNMLKKIGRLY